MPELPEVETVRRELAAWLPGRLIRAARRVDAPPGPKYAGLERARGQRILSVGRRGKFLLVPLSGGDELVIHLGMTGVLSREPTSHQRARLDLDRGRLYFQDPRRFGRFLVVPAGRYDTLPTLRDLGPEPLEAGFTAAVLQAGLRGRKTCIKAAIMGQRAVAGVGNIYTDEALWRARIHPETEAGRIGARRVAALRDAIVAVLAASLDHGGTTFRDYRNLAGETGRFVDRLAVYDREGEPCRRCGAAIRRIVLAQRGTWFCPRCQR